MKHLISISIIVVLLAGCRSTKKMTESSSVISNQTESVQKADVKEETKVNNDKTSYKRTTITETNYGNLNPTRIKLSDEVIQDIKASDPIKDDNVVKSVKVTVIEEGTKDNSVVETKKYDNSETAIKTKEKSKTEAKAKETKSIPFSWGWLIWVCFGLGLSAYVYFSKSKIAVVVKTFIKKLFA